MEAEFYIPLDRYFPRRHEDHPVPYGPTLRQISLSFLAGASGGNTISDIHALMGQCDEHIIQEDPQGMCNR